MVLGSWFGIEQVADEAADFGSASRGEARARDIDLLVEFNRAPSLIEFVQLKEQLEMILSRPVDLVSKKGCKARFLKEIAGDLRHVA